MTRLLIVDDEPLILENLYVLFREETDMELEVYKAESAEAALAIIDEVAIDILITDILMPGMTGLELQNKAMERQPNIKVIILTSYNDFSLIQTAQRNGSIDYIMKTEPDHVLLEAVQMIIAMLDTERRNRRRLNDLRSMQDELTQVNEMVAFSHFLETGDMSQEDAPLCLKTGIPSIMLTGRTDSSKNALLAGRMGRAIFAGEMNVVYSLMPNGYLVMLLQLQTGENERKWSMMKQLISDLCLHLQQEFEEESGVHLAICVSEEPVPVHALRMHFHGQKRALENVDPSALLTMGMALDALEDSCMDRKMEAVLNSGSRMEYRKMLEEFPMQAEGEQQNDVAQLLAPLLSYWCARGNMKYAASVADMLAAHRSIPEAIEFCREMEAAIFSDSGEAGALEENIVKTIENYAITRLSEDLSLQNMAAMLHYNPVYLSRMFKNVAGVNYSTWISELRLEEAKKQLQNDKLKIQDISERLGFESPSYFTRFFKKKTGLSPAQWRAQNG